MEKKLLENRKKMIYGFMCSEFYVPMKIKELAVMMDVPRGERDDLAQVLAELVAEGKIEVSKRGKYAKAEGKSLCGAFIGNARGFGFVEIEGEEQDIFIPEDHVCGAMDGDKVQISLLPGKAEAGKRREGKIERILERAVKQVVGTFQKSKNFGFVVPDNVKFQQDIFIPIERSQGAVNGHKVVVEITDYGNKRRKPEGKVVEVIGHINDRFSTSWRALEVR